MPLDLNYLPGIEKKTGKTTNYFVAAAIKKGVADPNLKPGVRMAWLKEEYGLGHGHALFMAHTIRNEMLKRAGKTKK
ncbi:MAG: DUF4287 domain-containing protein [Alphaproteobacteria bacterium]|nr:DUF4287 domain-containing protein [Alphaproteobacteria bacterium]